MTDDRLNIFWSEETGARSPTLAPVVALWDGSARLINVLFAAERHAKRTGRLKRSG